MALQNNVSLLLANEQKNAAKGSQFQALSSLLPQISASASQSRMTTNQAAIGIDYRNMGLSSPLLGPFNNFDARLRIVQNIFDLSSIEQYQAVRIKKIITNLKAALAREQTAANTTLSYIEALQAKAYVRATLADLHLALSNQELFTDRLKSGVSTALDLVRAETLVAHAYLLKIQADTQYEKSLTHLKRVIGIPFAQNIELTENLKTSVQNRITEEDAIMLAENNRIEIKIASQELNQQHHEVRSAYGLQVPQVSVGADYGISANTLETNRENTYHYGIQVDVPLFNGGYTLGKIKTASSQKRLAELAFKDVNDAVKEDVINAVRLTQSARVETQFSKHELELALKEYELAHDKFISGTGDGVDLVTAEDHLSKVRQIHIAAIAQYCGARASLAYALGQMEGFEL